MYNQKNSKTLITILLTVIVVLIMFAGINFVSYKKKQSTPTGKFEIRDGVETYVMSGQVIINSLVEEGDKLYYVDDKGHKIKDRWAIIDNDGNYGYFGSLGDLVTDRIREINGKRYYFDKNGILYTDSTNKEIITIEGKEYIANGNGELRAANEKETVAKVAETKATQVQQTQLQPTQVQQTVPATVAPPAALTPIYETQATTAAVVISNNPPFANAIDISGNNNSGSAVIGPGAGIATTTTKDDISTLKSGEVKIVRTEKVIDSIDGEDYECKITLLKPILTGETQEETSSINASIDELIDAWFDDVKGVVDDYVTFPKSVTFTSATLGTVKKASIIINISGTIKPKTGSTKTIKYRITYDRNEENADIVRTSTN